jgi:hypothetical protein
MINAISPIVSAGTSSVAYAAWANAGKQAQSDAVPASAPSSVASTSSSEKESAADNSQNQSAAGSAAGEQNLTPEQQSEVAELKQRDKQVRAHEQAHQSAGAGLTGAVSYTYTNGPDGKRYATGGEVSIDTSPVRNDLSGTIQKMQRVIAAALAPADPSSQDRAVAAQANSTMTTARMELSQEKRTTSGAATSGSRINAVA